MRRCNDNAYRVLSPVRVQWVSGAMAHTGPVALRSARSGSNGGTRRAAGAAKLAPAPSKARRATSLLLARPTGANGGAPAATGGAELAWREFLDIAATRISRKPGKTGSWESSSSSACEHVFFGFTTYHLPLFSGNATRETLFHQFCIPVLATFWYNFARFGMSASADGASALEVFRAFIKTPLGYSNTDAALEAASGLFRAWHALRRR